MGRSATLTAVCSPAVEDCDYDWVWPRPSSSPMPALLMGLFFMAVSRSLLAVPGTARPLPGRPMAEPTRPGHISCHCYCHGDIL